MKVPQIVYLFFPVVIALITCEGLDTLPPTITFTNIENSRIVSGNITISVDVTDNEAVESVELWLDGEFSEIADDTEPFELEWNTTRFNSKAYSVTVRAYDVNMNMTETDPINIIVDNEGPAITVFSVENNSTISGAVIISVDATDVADIEKVELWIDGDFSGIADAIKPYELEWNTIGYSNKSYSIAVRGYDVNNNTSETNPISVHVDNSENLIIPSTITNTVYVKSDQEFKSAIQNDNTYVIIDNDIILNTSSNYVMGNGVIINGNGDEFGIGGKKLFANGTMQSGAFIEMGNDSQIWGIKLIGNDSYNSKGIQANNKHNIKIMNCEITGFTNSAIAFGGNTSSSYKIGYISSNHIHDNQEYPYGYGVVVNRNSEVYINKNKFKNNRHHIASRDHKDNSGNNYLGVRYEASYNIVLENSEDENAHFDVHGNESYGSCISSGFLWDYGQAGNWIKIHHNIFIGNNETHILIRGVPTSTVAEGGGYQIYSNNFGPNMDLIATCADINSIYKTAAVLFTDENIVDGDNFNKYVTIYDNY